MSLVRLLSAARALTRLHESPTPYRLHPGRLLPKFRTEKDPFGSEKQLAPAAAAVANVCASDAQNKPKAHRRLFWPWSGRGELKASPANGQPGLRPEALRRTEPKAVQGELLMENVKVLRNDLRNSDVDLVMRPCGMSENTPNVSTGRLLSAMSPEKALDRLADQIVGAGHS
jgi:hypothetical protein